MMEIVDYRLPENRQKGFDYFYHVMCVSNDVSPDIAVEKWIADNLNFDFEKRCVMALFHGATYAGPCESMFADKFPVMTSDVSKLIEFFNENKKRLLFSPDAKYRKMVFPQFLESVGKSIEKYGTLGKYINSCVLFHDGMALGDAAKLNYLTLQEKCMNDWFHWGRMGHWCFAEALQRFTGVLIEPPNMEFETGKSHRDGWAFCVGRDDLTEKENPTKDDIKQLEESAKLYIQEFQKKFWTDPNVLRNANFFTLETACCNYKRQHKGSRYGLCYIDEQYDETMLMKKDWPEYNWLWDKYLEGRQHVFPDNLLYENHKDEPGNDSPEAYVRSLHGALRDYGRIPRVEAWQNRQPQVWTSLENMNLSGADNLMELFG